MSLGMRTAKCASSILRSSQLSTLREGIFNGLNTQYRALSATANPTPKVIFSGIQPTGIPHLGNYLGALKQWVKLQDEAEPDTTLIYSLVDLHAITIQQDPDQLRKWRKESFAMLLAIGLNPERSTIFHQSQVPAHSELMWILSCQASTGYLGRMTQWKEKTAGEKDNSPKLKLGLFSYPVLQAADILVHGATHVPVGHDQAQHLEFSRQVANGFNTVIGRNVLVAPETLISPAKRVMSLKDPSAKMSKSHKDPKSRILLTDSEEEIKEKIKKAMTDSLDGITYDPENRPGLSNLIDLLHYTDKEASEIDQVSIAKELNGMPLRVIKEKVATSVDTAIRPIRESYQALVTNDALLNDAAARGREKATESATKTLEKVKYAVGLS